MSDNVRKLLDHIHNNFQIRFSVGSYTTDRQSLVGKVTGCIIYKPASKSSGKKSRGPVIISGSRQSPTGSVHGRFDRNVQEVLNSVFLVIKKYILNVRTYKLHFSVDYAMHQIYNRIILDKRTMKSSRFIKRWQDYRHLLEQASGYWDRYNNGFEINLRYGV